MAKPINAVKLTKAQTQWLDQQLQVKVSAKDQAEVLRREKKDADAVTTLD